MLKIFLAICVILIVSKITAGPIISHFMSADFVEYNEQEEFIYAKGNIKLIRNNYLIYADSILYDLKNNLIFAGHDVIIYNDKNQLTLGTNVILKENFDRGLITNLVIKWQDTLLTANFVEKLDAYRSRLYKASFTPCQVSNMCNPIWEISAKNTDVDLHKHVITYKHVFFKIYGVPVFYTPYFLHPTPDAPAKSGILVPSLVNNSLKVPIYYRAKPNFDLTFSPRVTKNAIIYETEVRHKVSCGNYVINNNYGSVPYKNKKIGSNYFIARGNFASNLYNYGFDLNFVSDKAFLKNYYNKYDGYLTSRLYLDHVENDNYYLAEGLYFRDLKIVDIKPADPLVLPMIHTKNIVNLDKFHDADLKIETTSMLYNQKQDLNLAKTSILFSLAKNFISAEGHLFDFDLGNRSDIYIYKYFSKHQAALRNIPQLQLIWRYPITKSSGIDKAILIEPVVSNVTSPRYSKKNVKKFALIDPSIYEISENNIFAANRYGGSDYHEMGNRLSYGVNSGILSGKNYYALFLGQLLYTDGRPDKSDRLQNVGNINFNIANKFELFYRYRKGRKLTSIRDEIGVKSKFEKLSLAMGLVKLENIKKYYTEDNLSLPKNHLSQGNYNIDYQLTDNWLIGNEMQFELRAKSMQLIYKSIRVTYFKDCVKIALILYDDYTFDDKLGVKKNSSKTISVGLKVLNM